MSTEPEKKASLLAPLAAEYEPSAADADRVFAKIQASLLAAAAPAPSPVAAAGARVGRHAVLVGLTCAALALVGGTAVVMSSGRAPAPASTSAPSPAAPPVTAEPIAAPPATGAATMIPSVSIDSLPTAAPPASTVRGPASPPAASAPSAETLEKEARLLAEARRAVQRGDGTRALALLDEHAQTYPQGILSSDRAAERIVVLCSVGRRDQAVREARVFLAGRPAGPLTRRVTMSCAGDDAEPAGDIEGPR